MRAWGSESDIMLIGDLSKNMLGRTFCPLGDAAALPTISIVEKFDEEFVAHLDGKPCPYDEARGWWRRDAKTFRRLDEKQWLIW